MSKTSRGLSDIQVDLASALHILAEAQEEVKRINTVLSNARIKVNDLQQEFDDVVNNIRTQAPLGTKWGIK